MGGRWKKEEIEILRSIYENKTKDEIASFLEKPWKSIRKKAYQLCMHRNTEVINLDRTKRGPRKDAWTENEEKLLLDIYENSSKKDILEKIKRPWKSIWKRAYLKGLHRNPELVKIESIEGGKKAPIRKGSWSEEEDYKLLQIYNSSSKKYILSQFNRTWSSIRCRACKLKIQRDTELIKKDNMASNIKTVKHRYDVDFITQTENMKIKSKETNLKKRNVEYPSQSEEVKEKIKKVVKEKYGVDNVFKANDIKDKIKSTILKKYGAEYATQNPSIKEKIHQTVKKNNSFTLSQEEANLYQYLKMLDPDTESQVWNPVVNNTIDFYMPAYNMWIQYDGAFWHGKNKINKITPRTQKIFQTIERDKRQNVLIPNLVRFDSDEIANQENQKDLISFIKNKIEKENQKSNVCHQYIKKLEHKEKDKETLTFDPDKLKARDFYLKKEDYNKSISEFIKKYEWLQTVGTNPKWCFTAYIDTTLAGVVLINEPSAYSKLLGEETPIYEALIQRGATASWTPINLGSRLIMFACHWMVNNTEKRIFVGYGDPKAREIGTIYQACNFDYLGNTFGSSFLYQHQNIRKGLPFTAQTLKRTSYFISWCKKNNIQIEKSWIKENGFKNLKNIPKEIINNWYTYNKNIINESYYLPIDKKHKYALLLPKNKKEAKKLNELKNYKPQKYPKRSIENETENINTIQVYMSNYTNISKNKEKINIKSRITEEQKKYIITNYETMTVNQLSINLNEKISWIKFVIRKLIKSGELKTKNPLGSTKSRITNYKIDFIKNNKDNMTYEEMATHLKETKRWVKRTIQRLRPKT